MNAEDFLELGSYRFILARCTFLGGGGTTLSLKGLTQSFNFSHKCIVILMPEALEHCTYSISVDRF